MKISTLNRPIIHERKPEHDEQRFDALDKAWEEMIEEIENDMLAAYVYNNLPVLQFVAPVLDLMIEDGRILIIETTRVLSVDMTGMNRQQITKALIMKVKEA